MSDVVLRGKHLTDLVYVTGTRQVLTHVHDPSACTEQESCVIHAPSAHPLVNAPTHWRVRREDDEYETLVQVMERICPHGVFHPDPDDIAFLAREKDEEAASIAARHECCEEGCCGVR